MKRLYDLKNDEELKDAHWAAVRGAVGGAAWYGMFGAIAGAAAYTFSPVYRGLTFQFKVFLQMSAMVLGGMIEADKRLVVHEQYIRHNNRIRRDAEVWKRYEADFEAEEKRREMFGAGAGRDSQTVRKKASEEVDSGTKT